MTLDDYRLSEQVEPPRYRGPDAPGSFDDLARALMTRDGLDHTLNAIVARAVAALPSVGRASISLLQRDDTVASHAPSDTTAAALDSLQDELGEGPCHDCIRHQTRVIVDDMAVVNHFRWPRFAPVAVEHQVRAMCSLQLVARNDGTSGALNLYADEPGAFDASCLATASLIASHAALAVHGAQRMASLAEALESRQAIGEAKGILMERYALTEQQAFDRLVSSSQDTNIKLRDIAKWLVTDTAGSRDSEAPRAKRPPRPGDSGR